MTNACAGCAPIDSKMHAVQVPTCLEPIVFPSSLRSVLTPRIQPSYQCLACDRIWMFDEQAGYSSQRSRRLAA